MKEINAFLMFDGNCDEAVEFYKKCLNFEVNITRHSAIPGAKPNPATDNLILHARMQRGKALLLACDMRPGAGFKAGNNFTVSVDCETKKEVDSFSKAMAEGGDLTLAPQDMFWGAYFSMLTDKFGIDWMFSYENEKN